MVISRNHFFLILFIILVIPFLTYKIIWLLGSQKTTGTMEFVGHGNLGSVLGISSYPVIMFMAGADTFHFNGNLNVPLKKEQKIEIRYQKRNPSNAKINTFLCIWGDTITYTAGPLLIFLALFLAPDIIPKRSKVKLGFRRLVQVCPPGDHLHLSKT